ncbi:MAG: serine/threonine-protein kinase, partial [Chloroflexi bacterium]|nr:serine/threonine-protein kinase [Chloroflexota bacterium]
MIKLQARNHPWFEPTMLVGVRAGGYTLQNVLGVGGFGAVYSTRDEQGKSLAIKVLFPPRSREGADMADYTNRLSHFQREVQFAAGFRHPNIMRIHFSGSLFWHYDDPSERQPESYRSGDYNLPYYVTDDLPDSVEQRLRNGLFTSVVAVEIGKQVCEALEALHGADPSILHLDLNPSNVRLAEGGRVVITDFGLVRVEGIPQGEVTRETSWLPPYVAAPEQRAGEDLDIRTDIYQVGALLFLMVTGKTRREFAVMTLLEQPNVPQSLARVIERCTRHDKEMRFQDATRLKEALVSANPSFIDILRRLAHFLSRVDAHVSPVWKNPVTWLLGAILVFAIVWELGWVLPTDPVTITIASSSTKKAWLNQAVKDFNEASRT